MSVIPKCVHCLGSLREPGLWSSAWQCADHGECLPFYDAPTVTPHALDHLRGAARVPVWMPDRLPPGWCVSGFGWAGDERTGARATAVAICGTGPLGGPAEVAFVAEEPGVGLAARLAGLPAYELRAGEGVGEAKVTAAGHPAPLWALPGADVDHVAYAGESKGVWLAAAFWPASASLLLIEHIILADLTESPGGEDAYADLLFGAPSRRLSRPSRQAAPASASEAAKPGP